MDKIGIIGAGQMGNGIAHVCAVAGLDVTMLDVNPEALKKALETIEKNLNRQVKNSQLDEAGKAAALGRIKTTSDYQAFGDSELVIEAATENEAVKKKIFATLCPALRPDAVIASNTSSISITRLAASTD